ncbi:hypothetical protein NBRC3280_0690 [Acetobacter pasteurianus NBRC 3280]|uniref:Uncharacterized protein n=1 Tax=Acetobacter pasteurianus NBRC 3278 TaxID=1226660 RepID=A0A401X1K9_ACEPA|nr:hypothetical protein NBRC3277_0782 [Acetobacter pasteurianus NBRC 3277]GCD61679.1 hypothetical protein NBRC3278_0772 [Acetobacter pasteurianus NBRC 3278]GCD68055.1 hypothetical protein NBRC3280_0690 [Acetobacter pasteurianus NBRC 3280]
MLPLSILLIVSAQHTAHRLDDDEKDRAIVTTLGGYR